MEYSSYHVLENNQDNFQLTAEYEQQNPELNYDQALYIVENNLVDPCCSREEWVKLGTAMKSVGLDFDHFDRWSQGSPDQYDPKNCRSTWNGLKENRSGIGHLVKEAKYQNNFDASAWQKEWYRQHGHFNRSYRSSGPRPIKQSPKPKIKPPVTLSKGITSVTPIKVTKPVKIPRPYGYDLEYIYPYSDNQWVKRIEHYNHEGKRIIPQGKKKDKTIKPYHLLDGLEKVGKGDRPWPAYRQKEAIAEAEGASEAIANKSKYIFSLEGEACVDHSWLIGFPAISLQGGRSEAETRALGKKLKVANKIPILIPDHDKEGKNTVQKQAQIFSEIGLNYLVFELSLIWDTIPQKGDIKDWVEMMINQGNTPEEIGQILAEHLESLLSSGYCPEWLKCEEENPVPPENTEIEEEDLLKLEIQAYLKEIDPFKKIRAKSIICGRYGVSKQDFELLVNVLEVQESTPTKKRFSLTGFLDEESSALNWLIPGFLPVGDMIILSALPKVGKTLLATDIAYSVLTQSPIFGITPTKKGKVLLISSDEGTRSTKRRLRERGFGELDHPENMDILTHFDINDVAYLEEILDDFRPDFVVIDSLTSITRNSGISENDAEFAKAIYRLKEVLARYNASSLLIHHNNKNSDNKGVTKLSGSGRIAAAAWGIWVLEGEGENRILSVIPRETEQSIHLLQTNAKELWLEQGIYQYLGEKNASEGDLSISEQILNLLKQHSPNGLEMSELKAHFPNNANSLHNLLSRMVDKLIISKRKSTTNKRSWVYYIEGKFQGNNTSNNEDFQVTPPLPTECQSSVSQTSETQTVSDFQQIDNQIDSQLTEIDIPLSQSSPVNLTEPSQSKESETQKWEIDSPSEKVGGGESVSDSQPENVIQERKGEGISPPLAQEDETHNEFSSCEVVYEWNELIEAIDAEMRRINWTVQQGIAYLMEKYGQKSRQLLSDEQIIEFWQFLKQQPSLVH